MEQYYNFIGETLFSSYGLSISGAIEKVGKQNEISGAVSNNYHLLQIRFTFNNVDTILYLTMY